MLEEKLLHIHISIRTWVMLTPLIMIFFIACRQLKQKLQIPGMQHHQLTSFEIEFFSLRF